MYKIIFLTFLLGGCTVEIENPATSTNPILDVCLHKVYFDDCMKATPTGAASPNHNDWGKVISECVDATKSLAYRQEKNVKDECKTGYNY